MQKLSKKAESAIIFQDNKKSLASTDTGIQKILDFGFGFGFWYPNPNPKIQNIQKPNPKFNPKIQNIQKPNPKKSKIFGFFGFENFFKLIFYQNMQSNW